MRRIIEIAYQDPSTRLLWYEHAKNPKQAKSFIRTLEAAGNPIVSVRYSDERNSYNNPPMTKTERAAIAKFWPPKTTKPATDDRTGSQTHTG